MAADLQTATAIAVRECQHGCPVIGFMDETGECFAEAHLAGEVAGWVIVELMKLMPRETAN